MVNDGISASIFSLKRPPPVTTPLAPRLFRAVHKHLRCSKSKQAGMTHEFLQVLLLACVIWRQKLRGLLPLRYIDPL